MPPLFAATAVVYVHCTRYSMVPIFAMFFKSYGAQNGAIKNYPDLAPISDLFRGTTSLSFRARNGAGNHINLRGVCPRKHLTDKISGEGPDKTLIHGAACGANSTVKSGVEGDINTVRKTTMYF
jgi:hypothetical protein